MACIDAAERGVTCPFAVGSRWLALARFDSSADWPRTGHRPPSNSSMDVIELRERAKQEAEELGPVPANPREREIWVEERRGAIVLLAGLANLESAALAERSHRLVGEHHHPRSPPRCDERVSLTGV